jgi:hypothetical protein
MPHAFEGDWHPPGVVANGSFLWAEPVFLPTVGGTGSSFPFLKKRKSGKGCQLIAS